MRRRDRGRLKPRDRVAGARRGGMFDRLAKRRAAVPARHAVDLPQRTHVRVRIEVDDETASSCRDMAEEDSEGGLVAAAEHDHRPSRFEMRCDRRAEPRLALLEIAARRDVAEVDGAGEERRHATVVARIGSHAVKPVPDRRRCLRRAGTPAVSPHAFIDGKPHDHKARRVVDALREQRADPRVVGGGRGAVDLDGTQRFVRDGHRGDCHSGTDLSAVPAAYDAEGPRRDR